MYCCSLLSFKFADQCEHKCYKSHFRPSSRYTKGLTPPLIKISKLLGKRTEIISVILNNFHQSLPTPFDFTSLKSTNSMHKQWLMSYTLVSGFSKELTSERVKFIVIPTCTTRKIANFSSYSTAFRI